MASCQRFHSSSEDSDDDATVYDDCACQRWWVGYGIMEGERARGADGVGASLPGLPLAASVDDEQVRGLTLTLTDASTDA